MRSYFNKKLFALFTLTLAGIFGACSEGSGNSAPKDPDPTPKIEGSQEVSEMPTLGRTRQMLLKSTSQRLGRQYCDPRVFKRISIGGARDYISKINFGNKQTKETILNFVADNKAHIIPLLGQIKDEAPGANLGDQVLLRSLPMTPATLPKEKTTFNVLRLVYEPGIKGPIPPEMGCKDGVSFELSKLHIPLRAEDLEPSGTKIPNKEEETDPAEPTPTKKDVPVTIPEDIQEQIDGVVAAEQLALLDLGRGHWNNSDDPDDDDDDDGDDDPTNPPTPDACSFAVGTTGPCCHCSMGWTGEDGCAMSTNCPHGDCCEGDDKFCFGIDDSLWTHPGLLNSLPIGAHL